MRLDLSGHPLLWWLGDDDRPAEDSWAVRWLLEGGAVALAFSSGAAVIVAHIIDRLRGR